MKFVFSALLLFSVLALVAGQTKKAGAAIVPDDELVLREYVSKWLEADAKGDVQTINALLADEFSFLGGKSRADYLISINPDPTLIIESTLVEESKIQIYGETAIVTGVNTYRLKRDGRPVQARFPAMTVWVKKSGRWQCVKACTLPALP